MENSKKTSTVTFEHSITRNNGVAEEKSTLQKSGTLNESMPDEFDLGKPMFSSTQNFDEKREAFEMDQMEHRNSEELNGTNSLEDTLEKTNTETFENTQKPKQKDLVSIAGKYNFKNGTLQLYKQTNKNNFWKVLYKERKQNFYFAKDVMPIGMIEVKNRLISTELWNIFMADWSTEEKITCQLVCQANGISFKNSTCYLTCKMKSCDRRFRFKQVQWIDCTVTLVIVMSNKEFNAEHPKEDKQHREIRGKKRDDIKKLLAEKTVNEVYTQLNQNIDHELAEAGNMQHKVKRSSLNTICAEIKQNERTGCTVVDSALWALSKPWETIGESVMPKKKGESDPIESFMTLHLTRKVFNVLLMHNYVPVLFQQTNEKKKKQIGHFDATGTLVKELNCHDHELDKRILQYVVVTKFAGFTLNCFEFITNLHTGENQEEMLEIAIKKWKVPVFVLIIVDFSWASINACLNAFNKMNIIQYSQVLYTQLVNKTKIAASPFTKLGICSAHFMHLLSRFLERHLKDPSDVKNTTYIHQKRFVLQIFFCLMDSTDFKAFEGMYYDMCVLLLSKQHSELSEDAFHRFHKLAEADPVSASNPDNRDFEIHEEELKTATKEPKPNRENIPFYQHFKKIKERAAHNVQMQTILTSKCSYYNPHLLDLLTNQYMPYVFLWSRVGYDDVCGKRANNGLIEGYFSNQKNNVLKKKLYNNLNEYVLQVYKHTNEIVKYCKHPEVYRDAVRPRSNRNIGLPKLFNKLLGDKSEKKVRITRLLSAPEIKTTEDEKDPLDPKHVEEWSKKPLKKGSSFDSKRTISRFADLNVFKKMKLPNFVSTQETKGNLQKTDDIRSYFRSCLSPLKEERSAKRKFNTTEDQQIRKSKTGIIMEDNYHFPSSYIVARSKNYKKMLEYADFVTLNKDEQVSNFLIEFVADYFEINSKIGKLNICYYSETSTQVFLNNYGHGFDESLLNTILNSRKLFIDPEAWHICPFFLLKPEVNQKGNHWMLFIVNFAKNECHFYDSLLSDGETYFKHFVSFLKTAFASFPQLTHLAQTFQFKGNEAVEKQKDGTSCGRHVLTYIDRFVKGSENMTNIDPNQISTELKAWIYEETMDLQDYCVRYKCETAILTKNDGTSECCTKCGRFEHTRHHLCIPKPFVCYLCCEYLKKINPQKKSKQSR